MIGDCYIYRSPAKTSKIDPIDIGKIYYDVLTSGNPDDVLLVDVANGVDVTRNLLLKNSVKLAIILQKLSISTNEVAGFIGDASWKLLICVLSSLYLGVTVSITNPKYLHDDLKHFLQTTRPKILFVSKSVYDKIKPLLIEYPCVKNVVLFDSVETADDCLLLDNLLKEDINTDLFELPSINPKETVQLILFSSGTSGLPKGVRLTQENVKNCLKHVMDQHGIGVSKESVLINSLPLFHVFGLMITLGTLSSNARIILLQKFEPKTFLASIQKYKVNYLPVVPALLLFLAKSPLVEEYDLSSLKDIVCGSAPAGKEIEDLVAKRLKNVHPRQIYGLTECSGGISCTPPNEQRPNSVGKILSGYDIKIIDPQTKETTSLFRAGEICVRGKGVMKGYVNCAEETKADIDEDGFLHTGDLGYLDEDGYLYVVDRLKDVIKYKGFQVSPAQLEGILVQHPAVKEAGVAGKSDARAGELPTGIIVKQPGANVTAEELKNFVAERVHYEKHLHGGVVFVEQLPRNETGKLLRKQLAKLL